MKKIILLFVFFSITKITFAQVMTSFNKDAFLHQPLVTEATVKISSINLTGNYHELVIAIGFPDRNPTYPRVWASMSYPLLGIFRNGTLLKDYVDQQGGSIPMDTWFKPAFDTYFNTHSNGVYNVDFTFVKKSNGNPYTTTNTFDYFKALNGGDPNSVIMNNITMIVTEAVRNIYADNPSLFSGKSAIHFVFNVPGSPNTTKNEFWTFASGTIDNSITIKNSLGTITIYTGPVSYQWNTETIIHERMHIIGLISGSPSGFHGFPDRGWDVQQSGHGNLTGYADVMYHDGNVLPDQYSLFGLFPISSHDLMFLGWIKSDEIKTVRNENLTGVKLADINYTLTTQQKNNGFFRIAKLMLHENYDGRNHDEYLLLEYHNATEFDKNFTNYDEPLLDKYNKGILAWHIIETVNSLDQSSDNLIDIMPAVPYNGFYGTPIPNDSYPRNYTRDSGYNGITSGEYDHLDDLNSIWYSSWGRYVYQYLPDGGRHVWETTTTGPYNWYPAATQWFYRSMSMKSDFFTDATVKGRINSKITGTTRPSTKDWAGLQTYISILNARRVSNYMALDIRYNVFSGTLSQNTTIDGSALITGTLTIPSGVTLTVISGSIIKVSNGASLIVNGTLSANGGSASTPITFDFTTPNSMTNNGIRFNSGSSGTISFCKILNADRGIYENGVSVRISNSAISNCYYGIYLYNSSPTIETTNIKYNTYAGITAISNSDPLLKNNYIMNNQTGVNCSVDSDPKLGTGVTNFGNNISNNVYGVFCFNNSYPILGQSNVAGRNNLNNSTYNLYALSLGTVYAINNYWGATTPTKIAGTSTVISSPFSNTNINIDPIPPLSKTISNLYASTESDIPLLYELDKAYQLIASNNLAEARKICLNLVTNYPDYSVSYNALNLLKDTYPANAISSTKDVYKSLFNIKGKKNLYAMAGLILSDIDTENKLKQIDEVINNYKGESVVELALFDKFVYYYFELDDKENSLAVSKELDGLFPLSPGAVEAHRILGDKEYYNININPDHALQKTADQTPAEYALLDNYPNPFNPSTTISYSLPEDGKVQIKIFDVLGREVATLVNEFTSAGKHNVVWDGANFASGIYFYSITFKGETLNKKMLLVK